MAEARSKILCLEGHRETAALIARHLKARAFDVAIAHDGVEGLFAILERKPDLILCDLSLPIMSGLEVLERLKGLVPNEHVPFVLLTDRPGRDDEFQARRLGVHEVVSKPIDFDQLSTIIDALIARVVEKRIRANLPKLSDRELEVLTWVARGKTSAEIARKLGLIKRTVDFHIDCARTKLRAATRTEAAIKAAVSGLIKP